jgi:hypothetical protein
MSTLGRVLLDIQVKETRGGWISSSPGVTEPNQVIFRLVAGDHNARSEATESELARLSESGKPELCPFGPPDSTHVQVNGEISQNLLVVNSAWAPFASGRAEQEQVTGAV